MRSFLLATYLFLTSFIPLAQTEEGKSILLKPDRVFDGEEMHEDWVVLIKGEEIEDVGKSGGLKIPEGTEIMELPGMTVLPGLIEGHAHLLLYPYNQTPWNDQVLKESEALRVARATVHAEKTLMAGFTSIRDLGTEGAGYADVGIKLAIEEGIIPGPRMMICTRAIVATGSYGPKGFRPDYDVPLGAEPADAQNLVKVVRDQIGKGADFIKVYADYRWGPEGEARPTFSLEELKLIVETAKSSGREVAAHAVTPEAITRAVKAGVISIEHGDGATPEVLQLMKQNNVTLCPTLGAVDAIWQYFYGWDKEKDPDPEIIQLKKQTFSNAIKTGVTLCAGGDVGVYPHGDNVRELELMVDYGMKPMDVLRSATSINARMMGDRWKIGQLKQGYWADVI
ncbi:MAG: amidohydrolase family protein, partial [Bacteroidetes bacterium]|nr:amidohydrolase family protein [Bacteroidota bacterium]